MLIILLVPETAMTLTLSVNNNELEVKVLIVFQKIGCELSPRDLEACHRLRKNSDRVIVKFSRRKDCEQIISVKKN